MKAKGSDSELVDDIVETYLPLILQLYPYRYQLILINEWWLNPMGFPLNLRFGITRLYKICNVDPTFSNPVHRVNAVKNRYVGVRRVPSRFLFDGSG
jgi:hypothetical protein